MTQKQMVLKVLKGDGCITTFDAFMELGCTRLASRISELRLDDKIEIGHEVVVKKNRFGKKTSFFIYYLELYIHPISGLTGRRLALIQKEKLERGENESTTR